MTENAKDLADWVDSHVLVDALQASGEALDAADVPLVGRYFWNPKTGQVEPVSITSEREKC